VPRPFLLVCLLAFTLPGSAAAQTNAPASPASTYALAHRAVSTTNAEAQAAFDQGLTLLYAFNPEEARRAFERAAGADPALAIAWWGVAMSHGLNINTSFDPAEQRQGRAAIAKAEALSHGASSTERALIEAAAKRFAYDRASDEAISARAYRDAMNTAAAAFPLDDDVLTLAAEAEMDVHPWSYFNDDGSPTAGTTEVIARLQTVLARDPMHIGANHLAIHAFEESQHPESALASADRLASLSFEPAAEHLAHMPAHTYMRVGEYHEAGEANARAIALYKTYLAGDPAGHGDYFGHDCSFGVDAFMMSGEYDRAHSLAAACARNGPGMIPVVDFRFGHYAALPDDGSDFLAGMRLAREGKLELARADLQKIRGDAGRVVTIESGLLEAAIDRAQGNSVTEISALERSVSAEDGFGYSEPPVFFFPVRESLGAALYRAGRYADAARVFREDLIRNRENPRSLFGLWEVLLKDGQSNDATETRRRFEIAWRNADFQLDMSQL